MMMYMPCLHRRPAPALLKDALPSAPAGENLTFGLPIMCLDCARRDCGHSCESINRMTAKELELWEPQNVVAALSDEENCMIIPESLVEMVLRKEREGSCKPFNRPE